MLKIFTLFSIILFITPIFADISTIDKDFAEKIRPVTDFIKNNPLKSHPYYWSGFILTGNDEPIVNNYSWLYYILGSLGLLLIGFFIFRKKKKSY